MVDALIDQPVVRANTIIPSIKRAALLFDKIYIIREPTSFRLPYEVSKELEWLESERIISFIDLDKSISELNLDFVNEVQLTDAARDTTKFLKETQDR
jgi:hypothetical protein